MTEWDVLLLNKPGSSSNITKEISSLSVKAQWRKVVLERGNGIAQKNRRIGSGSDELAGLEADSLQKLVDEYGTYSKIPAIKCRELRQRPLLMLHLIDCNLKGESINDDGIIAYGVSFPGVAGKRRPEKLVEYQVNTVWWNNNYADLLEDEDEMNG